MVQVCDFLNLSLSCGFSASHARPLLLLHVICFILFLCLPQPQRPYPDEVYRSTRPTFVYEGEIWKRLGKLFGKRTCDIIKTSYHT